MKIEEQETEAAQNARANNIIQLDLGRELRNQFVPHPNPLPQGEGEKRRMRRNLRRHQVTRSRASWWFGQMRKAVSAAVEWKPVPPARPEQIYITLTPHIRNREAKAESPQRQVTAETAKEEDRGESAE